MQRAEAQVAHKKQALSDAHDALAQASDEFCQASRTYVVALDRYGDLLHSTAPTVGDVKEAGKDLVEPGDDALTAAESAVAANEDVEEAEQELADAKTALKRARSGDDPNRPSGESASNGAASASPLAPAATVKQVRAAESDFAAAADGVDDATPLLQASREFNAAAVTLELSWMQLVVDAGCLTAEEEQQAQALVRDYTTRLQQALEQAGYYDRQVDGVYGAATIEAVEALQRAHDLPVTGAVDKATQAALQEELAEVGGAAAQEAVVSTAAVQQTLKLAGYWDGPVDGQWTPELTDAVTELQEQLGVKPTGAVDAATLAALERAVADAGQAVEDVRDARPSERPADEPSATSSTVTPSAADTSSAGTG